MASLPAGVRRVYNSLYKRRVTGGNSYTPTPTQIKEYFDSQGFDIDSITDEQFNQTVNHFSKGELSLTTQQESTLLESQSVAEVSPVVETGVLNQDNVNGSDDIPAESSLVLTEQQLQGIVSTKAVEMSLQLSNSDIEYVAGQIDSIDTTLNDVLNQTENLLCAYADHKKQEGIQKIDAMFGRVYNHVQSNNEDTSQHISLRLQQFGRDVEQSQQDFKSSVFATLERLKVSKNSA
ncbi:MAG: hypothetical protein RM049_27710 [Nostoc sp. DedQUE04]|uniref:hypothetical protein n=1 Tax=Nostoc sp. DedQUE04 TaxID=3075390 RepID=UPI002AD201B9|nr:hypothetical protein [Nostoc sp. DedQUE04]MDZ8139022.1 hypothetical protein [Nostoc sp. DedQUE04]